MELVEETGDSHPQRPSSDVQEIVPTQSDLRLLTLTDPRDIDVEELSSDDYLKAISREGTQVLINKLFSLNTTRNDNTGVYVILPPPCINLPRSKPFPKEKIVTRWEKFAGEKGIAPKKKSKKVYSAKDDDFRNRWGYKGLNDSREEWLVEINTNEDPSGDKFKSIDKSKGNRIAKNKLAQLKNEYYNLKNETHNPKNEIHDLKKFPRGLSLDMNPSRKSKLLSRKLELKNKIIATRTSTASLGVFTKQLRNEKKIRLKRPKQKFDSDTIPQESETEKTKRVASIILKSENSKIINVSKAVKALHREQGSNIQRKQKKNLGKNKKRKR